MQDIAYGEMSPAVRHASSTFVNVVTALKTAIKKANAAIESNAADKEVLVKAAVKKIDQASAKGLIHMNNAARKKSALVCKLNKA